MFKLLSKRTVQLLIIVIATFLAYSNIFPNIYLGDDRAFFQDWDLASSAGNIPKLFVSRTNPVGLPQDYRPIRSMVLILIHQISGEKPWGYHVASIAIHLANTVLVYLVVEQMISVRGPVTGFHPASTRSKLKSKGKLKDIVELRAVGSPPTGATLRRVYPEQVVGSIFSKQFTSLPFITALLFGLHPIHTEAITYMLVSLNSIAFIFLFASFLFYLKSRYWLSVFLAIFAFFTFETALVLPLLLIFTDFCFGRSSSSRNRGSDSRFLASLKRERSGCGNDKKNMSIVKYLPYFAGAIFYVFMRLFVVHLDVQRGSYLGGSFYATMMVMPKLIIKYIELLIWPVNLSFIHNIIHGFETYPTPYSNFDALFALSPLSPEVFVSAILLFSIFGIFLWSLKHDRLVAFAVGWFFVSLLPAYNIFPIGVTMSERYLYLPSFGFCLLVGWGICLCYANFMRRRMRMYANAVVLFVVVVVMCYGVRTFVRNRDWRGIETFTKSILAIYPESLIARYNLALYYTNSDPASAVGEYQTLLSYEPRFKEAYFDLSKIYFVNGYWDEAIFASSKTIELDPNFLDAYIILAQSYQKLQKYDLAISALNRALTVDPNNYLVFQLPKGEEQIGGSLAQIHDLLAEIKKEQGKKK